MLDVAVAASAKYDPAAQDVDTAEHTGFSEVPPLTKYPLEQTHAVRASFDTEWALHMPEHEAFTPLLTRVSAGSNVVELHG